MKNFKFDLRIMKKVIFIAISAISETIIISVISLVINLMLYLISGPLGVAVYTAG